MTVARWVTPEGSTVPVEVVPDVIVEIPDASPEEVVDLALG